MLLLPSGITMEVYYMFMVIFTILTLWAGTVGWITQLVVSSAVRKCYIATQLLQTLKRHKLFQNVTAVGLVSSHPAAVSVVAKLCRKFWYLHRLHLASCKEAKPCGTLFEENCTTGALSCVFTQFYVNHEEPLEALSLFKRNGRWCLGELPEGHEFLVILPVTLSKK
jgi:hypothetical protein